MLTSKDRALAGLTAQLLCRGWRCKSTCCSSRLPSRREPGVHRQERGSCSRDGSSLHAPRSMRGCLRNSGFAQFAQAWKRVVLWGVVTPYKVSVFQKICRQALNVLIPSQTFSACFISSHLLADIPFARIQQLNIQLTQHEVHRTYSFGTWCLSRRLRCQ